MATTGWQFWIDRGGTFTDVVARRPDGRIETAKLLSEDPSRYPDAAVHGIRRILGLAPGAPVPPGAIDAVKMGTTVATNALLERKGEPTLLMITRGFGDALRIAYQNRPRLFDREIVLPELLYARVAEVDERVGAHGEVLTPIDEPAVAAELRAAYDAGLRAVAIVLMHGYRFPEHEQALARIARGVGFPQISVSHAVSPLIRLVARGDTTVADAYLSPILRRHVDQVAAALPGVPLRFMQSNGGLTDAARFHGKDAVLSGPAGGIVGMVRTAASAGFERLIGFDMGGTSTDVSHYAGEFERAFETQVAGVRLRAPMLSIHTVAAGGGSILHFDGARCRVGPDSAGALPGPACYRRGGPLTVTDANLMLGKLQPAHFPCVFGPGGDDPIDATVVRTRFAALADTMHAAGGERRSAEAVAEGFIEIAVQNMANAIRQISLARGHDVAGYTLAVFGGAGGQHACRVADALGITRVFAHPLAGVLSAYGMGLADQTALRERSVEAPLRADTLAEVRATLDALAAEAHADLVAQGLAADRIRVLRRVHLRYDGTDTALVVDAADLPAMHAAFEAAYRSRFAMLMSGRPLVVEAASVEAIGAGVASAAGLAARAGRTAAEGPLVTHGPVRMFTAGTWHDAPLVRRTDTRAGDLIAGPAIIAEDSQTTVVEPGWQAQVTALDHLVLERVDIRPARAAAGTRADPVLLEVFNNLFMNIAEQMGVRLQNTAHSVNIKERLDFSCALFDAAGNLIANAPHMPVHLGSMGESIRTVARENRGRMRPGDVFALNAPYNGGTHLPDITVVTPVFDAAGHAVLFYVGSRGHHADIGGTTPGSMPADSRTLDEEGILIDNLLLVQAGSFRERETRALLSAGPWPARNVDQNLADLRAQVAANAKGAQELHRICAHYGLEVVRAYMQYVQDNAEEAVRRVIAALADGAAVVRLDSGAEIHVRITVDRAARAATIDFTGTSAQQPDNFNAPAAIAVAAVLYVFRTLVDADIPLNAGCLRPLKVILPAGCMLNPRYPAAVAAGNVETSQCVTQALYGALGIMSESQGSMNNFTFGNERLQYYETLAGGSSAGVVKDAAGHIVRGFHGASVVQTHMTNSRLTDPEVLEWRFPVRVEAYRIRTGSGGNGQWRGGDGAVRRIRFLEAMTASILSNNRIHAPRGAAGGADGAPGVNRVERFGGRQDALGGCDRTEMQPGDVFVIETPGAGGYGTPPLVQGRAADEDRSGSSRRLAGFDGAATPTSGETG